MEDSFQESGFKFSINGGKRFHFTFIFILENRKNNYNGIGIWLSRLKETNTDTYIYLSTIKVTRPY